MECPDCRGELEQGALYLCWRDPSYWLPKAADPVLRTKGRVEKAGGVYLDPRTSAPLEAWYCRSCRRMILDVK